MERNGCLRVMISCLTIILIVGFFVLCSSCASILKPVPEPKMWESRCAANTILAIVTVGQDYPTRGRGCKLGDGWHIQTEYKKGGLWIPLQVINGDHLNWPLVTEGKIENDGNEETRLRYMSGKKVLMEYCSRLKGPAQLSKEDGYKHWKQTLQEIKDKHEKELQQKLKEIEEKYK